MKKKKYVFQMSMFSVCIRVLRTTIVQWELCWTQLCPLNNLYASPLSKEIKNALGGAGVHAWGCTLTPLCTLRFLGTTGIVRPTLLTFQTKHMEQYTTLLMAIFTQNLDVVISVFLRHRTLGNLLIHILPHLLHVQHWLTTDRAGIVTSFEHIFETLVVN